MKKAAPAMKKAAPVAKTAVPKKEEAKREEDPAPVARKMGKAAPTAARTMGAPVTNAARAARRVSPRPAPGRGLARAPAAPGVDPNKEFVDKIKAPSVDLRKTGADEDADPTLELGLLMDCTSSMSSWITRAKETLHEIIDKVIKECEEDGQLKCRVSFIGYRDIGDQRRFALKPFTDNIDEVKQFVNQTNAEGGADEPEDVQGGLKLCLLQDWTEEAAKRVVLITDAPPHGRKYHSNNHTGDDFPNGSPDGLILEDLMKEFCKKEIEFQVIKLTHSVDKMIEVMKEHHQEVEVTDMTGVREEVRAMAYERAEAAGAMGALGGGGGGLDFADAAGESEEVAYKSKFIGATVSGLKKQVKAKKGKC